MFGKGSGDCSSNDLISRSQWCVRLTALLWVMLALSGCLSASNQDDRKKLVVGLVTNNPNGLRNIQGFKDGMTTLGYREGEDIRYIFSGNPVKQHRLEQTVAEMITDGADLIFTAGTPTGIAAHKVTADTDIPVVFGVIADPLRAGVLTDLSRPGGNMTGVKLSQNQGRRLEHLLRIVPQVRRVFVPYNPEDAAPIGAVSEITAVATSLGVHIVEGKARTDSEVTELLADLPTDIDAIFLVPDSTVNRRLRDIIAISNNRKLPVSGPSTAQVEEGALTTYGFVHHVVGVQAARMADQISRGTEPADLPVQTAEFYLSINLKAADALGIEISDTILRQANMVIR